MRSDRESFCIAPCIFPRPSCRIAAPRQISRAVSAVSDISRGTFTGIRFHSVNPDLFTAGNLCLIAALHATQCICTYYISPQGSLHQCVCTTSEPIELQGPHSIFGRGVFSVASITVTSPLDHISPHNVSSAPTTPGHTVSCAPLPVAPQCEQGSELLDALKYFWHAVQ